MPFLVSMCHDERTERLHRPVAGRIGGWPNEAKVRMCQNDSFARVSGRIALAGILAFVAVCTAAQFLRTDLDWLKVPLSFYLIGPGGHVVKAAYLALALALVSLGSGLYCYVSSSTRSAAPLLLFIVSSAALAVTALAETDIPGKSQSLHGFVHLFAAATTFLCVTAAMLLQSSRMRLDPRWRSRFAPALTLAVIAFADLWVYAVGHVLPHGLMQKGVIVLIVLWLGWIAACLSRTRKLSHVIFIVG